MKVTLALIVFVSLYLLGTAQNFLQRAGSINNDEALDIAKDGAGNTYTCGYYAHTGDFGGTLVTSAGLSDGFLNKRNPSGQTLWVRSFGGTQSDRAVSVAVESSGNAIVTGFFKGSATFGSVTLNSLGGSQDIFVVKYDPNGNVLWAIGFGGSGDDIGYSVDVNASGVIAVGGQFSGSGTIGSFSMSSMGGSPDAFVAVINPAGVVQWAKLGQAAQEDRTLAVALDPSGNLYATGQFSGDMTWDNLHSNTVQNAAFLVKFSAMGAETGFVRFAGPQVLSNDLKFTPDGHVACTGNFVGGLTFFYPTPQQYTGAFNENMFVFKANTSLNLVWFKSESSENELLARAIDFDQQSHLYVTGTFKCTFTDLNAESGQSLWKSFGYRDVFMFRYTPAGTRDRKLHFGGRKDEMCQAITARDGHSVMAGGFEETICVRNHISFIESPGNELITGSVASGCSNHSVLRYVPSFGNRDVFITRPFHQDALPFDFYNHEPPTCQWNHKPLCLKAPNFDCCQNATVCQGTVLQVCSYYQFSESQLPGLPMYTQNVTPSVIANASGTYSVNLIRADGCYTLNSSIQVTVEPTPQPPTFSSSDGTYVNEPGIYDDLYICGNQVTLSAGTNNPPGTFEWSGPNGVQPGNSVTVSETGMMQLQYTSPVGCQSTHFVDVFFEYQPQQMILDLLALNGSIIGDTIYLCPNEQLNLGMINLFDSFTAFDIQIDTWTFDPPTAFQDGIGASVWLTPVEGWLTINATLEFIYCPDIYNISKSWYIKYYNVPDLNIQISGPTLLCPGESAVLTFSGALGPVSWWDFPGTVNDVYFPTLSINAPGTYTAITEAVDANLCLSTAVATHIVIFKSPPTITMNPTNGVLCPGETVTLSASGTGMTFQWFNPSGTLFSTAPTATAGSPGPYYVIGTDAEGCATESQFVEIYLYSSPFLLQFPEQPVLCNGQPILVTVFATPGSSIEWGPPLNTNATQVALTNPGVYTVSATICNLTETLSITVVNAVDPPTPFFDQDAVLCPGGSMTLFGESGYENYFWLPVGVSSQNLEVSAPGTYTLVVSDANGCQAESEPIAIAEYVVEGSTLPDETICFGGTAQLTSSTSAVVQWYMDAGLTQIIGTGTLTYGPITSGITLYYTFDDGICTSNPMTVLLSPFPQSAFEPISDVYVCSGESGTLEQVPGLETHWLDENMNPLGTGNLEIVAGIENQIYHYYLIDENNCPTDTGMVTVIVPFGGQIPSIFGDTLLCQGENLVLQTNLQASTYMWTTPLGTVNTTTSSYQIANPGPQHSGAYKVTLQTGPCFANSASHVLEVIPVSQHVFTLSDFSCVNYQLTVTAPQGFDYYLWNGEPGAYFQTFINHQGIELIIGNEPGCERKYVFGPEIPYCPDFLPNIISPNGDGINEGIDFLAIFGKFEKVLIFNRWGTKVRELTMDAYFWDGTMDNGKPCSDGTYYYIVFRENEVPGKKGMSGYVTVVR
jgi:gliding motility-associated-like protein